MKIGMYVRITTPTGQRYCPPVYNVTKNSKKLRAGYAMVDGVAEAHCEAIFTLRYPENGKRVWQEVGTDPSEALAAKQRREHLIRGREIGQPVSYDTASPASTSKKRLIAAQIKSYVDDLTLKSKNRTLNAYEKALQFFAKKVEPVLYLEDLTREHDSKRYLRALFGSGISHRTIANRIGYVQSFLILNGYPELLVVKDKPKYTERDPNAYNKEFLKRLFAACNSEDRQAFQFFLGSGSREQEVTYACWPDLDLVRGTFTVREKKDLGWTVKDYEERTIRLPSALVADLKRRRRERPDDRFLFPTKSGKPEGHFLRRLKKVALRAGLNCGHCINKKGQSCRNEPACQDIELHRFRRTFATLHHEQGRSIKTIQRWLGHSDIETTMRYLANAEDDTAEVREGIDHAFAIGA